MTDRCWPVLSVGIGSTVARGGPVLVPATPDRSQGYSSGQRVTARPAASRIDAASISARDSAMPLPGHSHTKPSVRSVVAATSSAPRPRLSAAAPSLLMQHRSIWLVVMVVGGTVKVGGFTTVGEHTEAEELIGERVAFDGDAVQQVRELLLLLSGDVAPPVRPRLAQALGAHEPHPYHSCCRTPTVGACFRPPTTSCCLPGSRAYRVGVGSRGCADPRWSVPLGGGGSRVAEHRRVAVRGRSLPYRVHPAQAVAPSPSGSSPPRRGWSALARRSLSRRRGS